MNDIHAHMSQAGKGRLFKKGPLKTQIGRERARTLAEEIGGVAATSIRCALAQIKLLDDIVADWEEVIAGLLT